MSIRDLKIKTPCPSCGRQTLFIDDAGNLVCSLIGCREPITERAFIAANNRYRIGDRCRSARRFVEENLADVADAMGVSIQAVSAMERGVENPQQLKDYWDRRFGIGAKS